MKQLPSVAIIGRPNVGKSTLFNALVGKKKAIVSDVAGTTRDNVVESVEGEEFRYLLVDTAGLTGAEGTDLEDKMQDQAKIAAENADVLLFVLDSKSEITQDDRKVVDMLRKSKKPVLLVANKVDDGDETRTYDLAELGLGLPMAVSGKNFVRMWELGDEIEDQLRQIDAPTKLETEKKVTDGLKIAFIGRPNAGKSTLLNAFVGKEVALVDNVAGTTRDSLGFDYTNEKGEQFYLLDTAGLRRKGRNTRGIEFWSAVRTRQAINEADVCVLVLDALDGATHQDVTLLNEVVEAGKGILLAVNKFDLVRDKSKKKETDVRELKEVDMWGKDVEQIRKDYWWYLGGKFPFAPWVPMNFISAKNKKGIDEVLESCVHIQAEREKRISTADLNRLVPEIKYGHVEPSVGTKRGKIKYLSQVGTCPPKFVFFVNNSEAFHWSYKRYCENKIRAEYSFFGSPVRVEFKDAMGEKRRNRGKE